MSKEKAKKDKGVQERKKIEKPKINGIDLDQCVFADDYFLFEGETGIPRYKDMNEQWNIFMDWISKTAERKKEEGGEDNLYVYQLGQEVLKWARNWDTFGLYMLTKVHWSGFRDNYMTEDAPKIVREIMDNIMLNKMTEKQKWGTDEDRKPKGQLLIFKNMKMTPEESYRLTMKERRRKYDPKKHAQRVLEEQNKLPEHDIWEL